MGFKLYEHQEKAIKNLHSGNILCGGVGSGKSVTAISYFLRKECNLSPDDYESILDKTLYIITTARKRDTHEWEQDLVKLRLTTNDDISRNGIHIRIDSWNNISKYTNVTGAFFIFDEQRLVGSGAWVKSFYEIAKKNRWILLSATPGDTWMDYIPIFIANGFYRNKTEFIREHVIFEPYVKYPKVKMYINTQKLISLKNKITVYMNFERNVIHHDINVEVGYDEALYKMVQKDRINPYKFNDEIGRCEPVRNASEYSQVCRRVTNSSMDRKEKLREILEMKPRVIIFYTFDYELDILREVCEKVNIPFSEWNGHKHMDIPKTPYWAYLVQYTSGSEGWNCIETNFILFYGNNHSYKMMTQAAGRIDRLNTPFQDLWTVHLVSRSSIDLRIKKCLKEKRDFNDTDFYHREFKKSM